MIILAAAIGLNDELGRESGKPLWDLPDEYNRFRESIRFHPVIMGRKSYDVVGTPLPDSLNIVITHQDRYDSKGALVVHSLSEAIERASGANAAYIIGGGIVFQEAIRLADRMEISRIEGTFPDATAFFPKFSLSEWQLVTSVRHEKGQKHAYAFNFEVWIRQ